ncbi:MAG: 4-(cytidine 5'-diphospho)-2-C-methyl-D-erythritol kinase [Deltaproteobacteria bacterium]|nr:4-(cytidine 5'-diphospho)-2-C-methyl-D-erythritol kinase [Deltaproteobacteria bacterium]
MRIRTPAKVNLYLRVLGQREDGYHLLDTVMVPVSLYDELEIRRPRSKQVGQGRLKVFCDHPMVPSGRRNLAYQAASLLLRKKRVEGPVHIRIRKRIPVGAGLGGGSSDAAATLLGLNRLFRLRCTRTELSALAASLGADVPFFIYRRPARAQGIGERLRPRASIPRLWIVILYPGFPVSTRWVYQNLPLKLTKSIENTSISASWKSPKELAHFLVNDLEKVAICRYPQIGFLKQRLIEEGAVGALMTGSGSSVFGIFSTGQNARSALRHLRTEKGAEAFLVHTLS